MDIALPDLAAVAEGLKPLLDWRGVPVDLASLAALAAGLGWASGLRLYALVFVLGALARFAGVQLPGGLGVLAHPVVLGVSGLLLLVEFFADKLPWLDSAWDAVHTFIHIPAGAALAAAVMGDQGGALQVAMGLVGGTLVVGQVADLLRLATACGLLWVDGDFLADHVSAPRQKAHAGGRRAGQCSCARRAGPARSNGYTTRPTRCGRA